MDPRNVSEHIQKPRPSTKWEDVCGLDDTKKTLLENVVLPIKFPQLFKGSRRSQHPGILLYGAPGTGKTLLTKALASQVPNASYIIVHTSDLVSKHVGQSEKLVQALFDKAREDAPSILVIDDLDSFCPEKHKSGTLTKAATEFLVQMRQCWKEDTGVHVVGTSNVPWKINSDFRRLFSKRTHVPLPDSTARSQMFKQFMGETAHSLSDDDFILLGEKSEGFTGSDICCTVRDAQMEPIREVSRATHFKQVTGPSFKNPAIIMDDLLTPCSPEDPAVIKMDWTEIHEDKCLPRKVDTETLLHALSKSRPTVSNEDLENINKFKQDFGPLDQVTT